jgi:hypothetical protein
VIRRRRSSASRVLAKENALTPSPASALALRGLENLEGGGSSDIDPSVVGKGMAFFRLRPSARVGGGAEERGRCDGDNSLVV